MYYHAIKVWGGSENNAVYFIEVISAPDGSLDVQLCPLAASPSQKEPLTHSGSEKYPCLAINP